MPEILPEITQEGSEPQGRRMWWTELMATLLLGLAAVGVGWAAYQAALWASDQTFALYRANDARRNATFLQNKAYLVRVVDVGMFTAYAQAVSQNNVRLAEFILQRFRPPMKTAVNAWLATKPLKNPNAPPSPFAMKEYRLPEEEEAVRIDRQADQLFQEAQHSNETSDRYVAMTVFFALVSLFCGLSPRFRSPGIRTAINGMAAVIFVGAVVALAHMPVR